MHIHKITTSPDGKHNMEDTYTRRQEKEPFVGSKGKHFFCVSFLWGLLTRLSWVSDGLGL